MGEIIRMGKEQVARREYEQYNPERHDFRWNADYTEVTIIPLTWWDDSSYAAYQGDSQAAGE